MARPMLRSLMSRAFGPQAVRVEWTDSTRRIIADVERRIEDAWRQTLARPGVRLFDGPICRFESAEVANERLLVRLSRTSYRVFVGTNFCNPNLADEVGLDVMANSMGVSSALLTADGFWLMGRRNASVAYYPGRVHPFAGSIEPADVVDLFANARRELREELRLADDAVAVTRLVGLVEDAALRHPEAIFLATTPLSRTELAAGLDADEHDGVWACPATPHDTAAALKNHEPTPVARAALLLGGRHVFGEAWFDEHQAGQFL